MTVETLLKLCQNEIMKGNGKKEVLLSDDEEENGYHDAMFGFMTAEELKNEYAEYPDMLPFGVRNGTMLLG